MKVDCPNCGAQYNFPDEMADKGSAKVKCRKCTKVFVVDPKDEKSGQDPENSKPPEDAGSKDQVKATKAKARASKAKARVSQVEPEGLPQDGEASEAVSKESPPQPEAPPQSEPKAKAASRTMGRLGGIRRAKVNLLLALGVYILTALGLGTWAMIEHTRFAAAHGHTQEAMQHIDVIAKFQKQVKEKHQKELEKKEALLDEIELKLEDVNRMDSFFFRSAQGLRAQKDYKTSIQILLRLKRQYPESSFVRDVDGMIMRNLVDLGELTSGDPLPPEEDIVALVEPQEKKPEPEISQDPVLARFKELYLQLLDFKDDPGFHDADFDSPNPYSRWMKKVEELRDSPEGQTMGQYGISPGHLIQLAQRYKKQKGQESKYTEMVNPLIRKGLGME